VGDSPQRGASDAWVTLVEFGDFECGFCRAEEPVLASVEAVYGPDLRVVFKHYPLLMHADARPAAVAAECANAQGHFWEMHDLLFRTALDPTTLAADAAQVPGLDVAAWQACLDTPDPTARVNADIVLGSQLGIPGTPTFVVNGKVVLGAVAESGLRAAIEQARDTAIASGIPRAVYYDQAVLGQ
jgi:protein-disulfide isomerase